MINKVTYQPFWAITFLALGPLNLYLGYQSDRGLNMVLGAVFLIMGILYFFSPAVVYSSTQLEMKNLLGITLKRYSFEEDTFSVQNGRIYVNGKKINISPMMVKKKELNELVAFVTTKTGQQHVVSEFSDDELLDK
jgi:hypothetical protein